MTAKQWMIDYVALRVKSQEQDERMSWLQLQSRLRFRFQWEQSLQYLKVASRGDLHPRAGTRRAHDALPARGGPDGPLNPGRARRPDRG